MNLWALPFTPPILLAEFPIGGLSFPLASDVGGLVAQSFVKLGGAIVLAVGAVLPGEVLGERLLSVTATPR